MCISVTRHRHHRCIGRPAELQTDLATLFGAIAPQLPEAVATSPYRPVSSQVRSAIDAVRACRDRAVPADGADAAARPGLE